MVHNLSEVVRCRMAARFVTMMVSYASPVVPCEGEKVAETESMVLSNVLTSSGKSPSALRACISNQPQHVTREKPFLNLKLPAAIGADAEDAADAENNTGSVRAAS